MNPYIILGGTEKAGTGGVTGAAPDENTPARPDTYGSTVRVKTDKVCLLSLTTVDGTAMTFHDTLGSALSQVYSAPPGSAGAITLLTDIKYNAGISVSGYTVIFDLNGHTLDVTSRAGDGLTVVKDGVVDITGAGVFNVTSSSEAGFGVFAGDGGQATVTSATVTGTSGVGVAVDDVSRIEVKGDVVCSPGSLSLGSSVGVVTSGGEVIVHGNVSVTNATGVYVSHNGTVVIDGDLTVCGAAAEFMSGVASYDGGTVTINGAFTMPPDGGAYIWLGADGRLDKLAPDNGVPGTGDYAGYLAYTDGTNHIYVKAPESAALTPPARAFDKDPAKQADLNAGA